MDQSSSQAVELVLHRAAAWQKKWVAAHQDVDWEDDETFRLVRDLADVLKAASRLAEIAVYDPDPMKNQDAQYELSELLAAYPPSTRNQE